MKEWLTARYVPPYVEHLTFLINFFKLGRVVVFPVLSASESDSGVPKDPVLLVVLNSTDAVEWGELQIKVNNMLYLSTKY